MQNFSAFDGSLVIPIGGILLCGLGIFALMRGDRPIPKTFKLIVQGISVLLGVAVIVASAVVGYLIHSWFDYFGVMAGVALAAFNFRDMIVTVRSSTVEVV